MPIFSTFAIYFIIWWLALFIVLPIGLRTQADENEVVPGSVESAPARFLALRVFLMTSVLAAIIHAGLVYSVRAAGLRPGFHPAICARSFTEVDDSGRRTAPLTLPQNCRD